MKRLSLAVLALWFAGTAVRSAETPPPPGATGAGVVYVIPIRKMIEPALLYVIRRGMEEARAENARAVIFVMDTPGGTVDAAREIVYEIQRAGAPTYTFVEKNAFSAGAIIALATKAIYMAPGSVIGDAMPIMMTPFGGVQELPAGVEEKTVSGVAALIRAAAEQGGHNPALAEAMVRRELEYKVGDRVVSPAGQLLTLTDQEAAAPTPDGAPLLSAGTIRDVAELLQKLGLADARVRELRVTGAERIARFIAGLAPLFLMAGLLGLYIEFKTPGFGVPGTLGLVSLAIFFWGHHIAGLAGYEELLIFAAGVALLAVEVFVLPGFGFTGILGVGLMAAALLMAMTGRVPELPGLPAAPVWPALRVSAIKLSWAVIGATALGLLAGRWLPQTPGLRRLMLRGDVARDKGFASLPERPELIGRTGRAVTPLRPAGTAEFDGRRVDVLTDGEFIEAGATVRARAWRGGHLLVAAESGKEGAA